ncbi:MAG TPA: CBS domain-containing protein [Actinomycetota bacterium]|jgi:CBS domain-containing protein|nr:CBS domain-containing protein [Actinomycetota bacterium]
MPSASDDLGRQTMGFLGTIATFGIGYAAGAVTRPSRLDGLSQRVRQALPAGSAAPGDGSTVDVREVRQVMTAAPDAVSPTDTLQRAAQLMRANDIGDVLVEGDQGSLLGIITDRDIAIRAIADGRNPATATIADIYTRDVATVAPTDSVHDAVLLMRSRDVRRLPVVESGKAIGIVSLGDLEVETRPGSPLADISTAAPDR